MGDSKVKQQNYFIRAGHYTLYGANSPINYFATVDSKVVSDSLFLEWLYIYKKCREINSINMRMKKLVRKQLAFNIHKIT